MLECASSAAVLGLPSAHAPFIFASSAKNRTAHGCTTLMKAGLRREPWSGSGEVVFRAMGCGYEAKICSRDNAFLAWLGQDVREGKNSRDHVWEVGGE